MRHRKALFDFVLREWLLLVSMLSFAVTSLYLKRIPTFSISEIQVLFLLWVLFITVKGLGDSGLIRRFSQNIEKGKMLPLKLVIATFILSMIVTNDIALIVIVPVTLSLTTDRKDILVILEALAANAGSALTPFGNPQNLFIYWFYHITPMEFVTSIAPFSLFFLGILLIVTAIVKITPSEKNSPAKQYTIGHASYIYGLLLIIVILTVLRILPIISGVFVLAYVLIFDRSALRVDYGLLVTFLCFFGLAENGRFLLASSIEHSGHVFLFSALLSQVISNVPTALLFAKFTTHWKALLWGTNVGGFGNLISSLANLIAYKLYINHYRRNRQGAFTIKFIGFGYAMFFMGIAFYLALEAWL